MDVWYCRDKDNGKQYFTTDPIAYETTSRAGEVYWTAPMQAAFNRDAWLVTDPAFDTPVEVSGLEVSRRDKAQISAWHQFKPTPRSKLLEDMGYVEARPTGVTLAELLLEDEDDQ